MPRSFAPIALVFLAATPAAAQIAPPAIGQVRPFGAAAGETLTLEILGTDLDDATAVRFDDPRVEVEILEPARRGPNDPPSPPVMLPKTRVVLPPGLPPGPLRFRVVTPRGVSNPGSIRIGRALPLVTEKEPNNSFRKPQAVGASAAIEGVIEPGNDVDVFAVDLEAGETLVAEAVAARAGSGLDALLTIFSPGGRELASDDDVFGRDAAVAATAPVSGRYLVVLQDADGKKRDDKAEKQTTRAYRLEIGRFPLVTGVFPAGGRRGEPTTLRLLGANLPDGSIFRFEPPGDSTPGDALVAVRTPLGTSNAVTVRVGEWPEVIEAEPNDEAERAEVITVPAAINGTLSASRRGDLDGFRLKAAPGHEGAYRITAYAARIGSPADPVLTVLGAGGEPQAEDDDALGRDARIERAIDAKDGIVLLIRDYHGRGGPAFVYRIEAEPIGRRVTVTADLGPRTVPRAGGLLVPIAIERRGYDGPLTVLPGELPPGVAAAPITLPARAKTGFLVVSAASDAPLGAFPIRLTTRDVPVSADVVYRERSGSRDVEIESAAVLAVADRAPLGLTIAPDELTVAPGGQAEVKVTLGRRDGPAQKAVKLRLLAPDGGLDGFEPVREVTIAAGASSASMTLKARPDAAPRRLPLAVRAWFEDSSEPFGVAAGPVTLVVPDGAR